MSFTARNIQGNSILISEAEKCSIYFCTHCNKELIVKNGLERVKHFSHKVNSSCVLNGVNSSNRESFEHLQAKELLKLYLERKHQIRIIKECSVCFSKKMDTLDTNNARVVLEYRLDDKKVADVTIIYENGMMVVLEILKTHMTSSRNVPWYEIRADDIIDNHRDEDTMHTFRCTRKDRRCKGKMCLTMKELALRLGFLGVYPVHSFEELRPLWKDKKVNYKWTTKTQRKENKEIWEEFLRREKCLICCKKEETSFGKPYCYKCYRTVREDVIEYIEDTPNEMKEYLITKYSFLFDIKKISDDTTNTCVKCNTELDSKWMSRCPLFFYGPRSICYICVDKIVGLV